MSTPYRQLPEDFLLDPRLRNEAPLVLAVYAHAATSHHLSLEGTGRLPAGYLAVDLRHDVDTIQAALDRLVEVGLIACDKDGWMFVPALLRDRGTPNHRRRAAVAIDAIPDGPLPLRGC